MKLYIRKAKYTLQPKPGTVLIEVVYKNTHGIYQPGVLELNKKDFTLIGEEIKR